ncbi:uncharacterized protein LOC115588146 [Sparus aurata]|uniref:uncharacterized protein LOC115588146 n=1 Tax=Sparus aurata TaxID=8175 RepID=UPI0011C1B602|nr:uncharacterized protein LOC115588146 [Sparus aurata]
MAFALMAWVWIGLILAQRNKAGSHRYAQGRLGSQEAFGAAPQEWTDRSSYVPVWNFLQVSGASDINQPQYRCSNGTLSLRFSLIRYSNLHLEDGAQLLLLPDKCHRSVHIPYTGCRTAIQSADGSGFWPFKLHYFDHLLQENMTGMAVCEKMAMSPLAASPLVTCRTESVTVKLPRDAELKKVKRHECVTHQGYSVRKWRTPTTLFVEMSKLPDRDSGFEVVYLYSGELCMVLASCAPVFPEKIGRHHIRRSLEEPDVFDLWGFDDIPVEPFDPEGEQTTTQGTTTQTATTGSSGTDTTTIEETVDDGDFSELWGFEGIPDKPYIGIDVTDTPTTAAPTTAAPTTTAPTTAVPITVDRPFHARLPMSLCPYHTPAWASAVGFDFDKEVAGPRVVLGKGLGFLRRPV